MTFQFQLIRILLINPLGWAYWAFCVTPLIHTIFGRNFGGWTAVWIFGSMSLGGMFMAIALAKNAVQTRRYI